MEKYQIWLALGTLTLLFVSALADDVVVLTEDNFEKEVGLDKGALVKFYAPWCGHCKKFAPEYEKLGSSFKKAKSVFIGKVDCDVHKSLCNKYGVSSYPNFQWFPKGSLEPKKYEGPRTAESLAEFVNNEGGKISPQVEVCQMGIQSASQPSSVDSISKEIFHEEGEANLLDSYSAWQAKHPSALEEFERMIAAAKGTNIVVFLDYDGTLTPIVEDASKAFMSDTMRSAVQEVAHYFRTAIVTGRSLDKVNGFVQLKNVTYAGSHGMDISTPSGFSKNKNHRDETRTFDEQGQEVVLFQPAQQFLPTVQVIFQVLEDKVKNIKGAMVEDNKFCISVHFRRVAEEDVNTLKEIVNSTVEGYPKFRVSDGKKVMEIRPRINWDKGRALEYLLETFGFNSSTDFLPMYIGDDKTDEDAFKVIREIGRGYPIVVSSVPRETNASFSLRDPDEVMSFLLRLANWKKKMLR